MALYNIHFSPTGGTKKAAGCLMRALGGGAVEIDLIRDRDALARTAFTAEDLCVVAVPSFGGRVPSPAAALLRGCETVVLESNHDPHMLQAGPYPYALKQRVAGPNGHLSNPDCAVFAAFLADNGTRKLVLAHLSEKNNMPALALQQTKNALRGREGCTVCVAPRDCMESPVVFGEEGAACLVSG